MGGRRGDNGVEVKESEVLRLIRIDEMTGLYNKVYFIERVRDDMLRSERYGWPLSLLVLSIDQFDKIRADYGPIIGDNIAVTVADMVRKFARNTDIVGREDIAKFAILLPGTAGAGAETIAERLHRRITSHLFSTKSGQPIQVTCSLGLSEFDESFADTESFLGAAEAAREAAVLAGGNRWHVAPKRLPAG